MSADWIVRMVDQAWADLAKIERGEWTAEDDARVAAEGEAQRVRLIQEQARLYGQQTHYEYLNELSLVTARQTEQGASELASNAQFDYELAVREGEPADLDAALGRVERTAEYHRDAAQTLDRMEEVCANDDVTIDLQDFV
jgi:hypothetical protein